VKASFFLASALAVVASFHGQACSQSDMQKQSDVIIAAEREWAKAAVDRNVSTFSKYMSDDYVLIAVSVPSGKGPQFDITTKSNWVEQVRSGREKYDSVEIHDLKVFLNGDFATVTGAYSQKGTSEGKDISASGVYVDTWVKRNGQWQLINSTFP
jgi:ketosteroid isomerase-like protein